MLEKNLKELAKVAADAVPTDTKEGDITVHASGDNRAYFISGDKVVASNSPAFAQAVAARIAKPVPVSYGTAECPAGNPNEAVMLVRMDTVAGALPKVLPLAASLLPQLEKVPTDALLKFVPQGLTNEPMIITLGAPEGRMKLSKRVNMAKQPVIKAAWGKAQPLAFASMLPGFHPHVPVSVVHR